MKRPKAHPDNLFFPIPPARIDRTLVLAPLLPAVADNYLSEIQRWRNAVVAAVATNDPEVVRIENFTARARSRLMVLLATGWDSKARGWAATSGYGLAPFPASRLPEGLDDPMKAVMDVLHWRVTVVNYLTDVWDVLGKPELEMGECMAIGTFMRPARLEGRCVFCLTEFGYDRLDPDEHGCVLMSHVGAG
jgi:hypothetical protein